MDKIKNFLVSHFEKLAMVAAILIAMMFLMGVFRRGRVDDLRESIGGLIRKIKANMENAGVEDEYDPDQLPDYKKKALGPFENVQEGEELVGMRFSPIVIIELKPIKLELPPNTPFEETYEAYPENEAEAPPEATAVRIDNDDLGTVELVDGQHFVLRRAADLPSEDGSTLIHIFYKDERHAVRRLEVKIRIVYIPQPPPQETIAGYPKPGRNFIIWQTHPDDIGKIIGFNVYRKESEEAGFDTENPFNRKLIQPLDYVPKLGEDEEGETGEEDGEPAVPGEEAAEDKPIDEKGAEEGEPAEEGEWKDLEDEEEPGGLPAIFARNVGGKFVDRGVTPLQTYWYAVQTVAKKPEKEREIERKRARGEKEVLYVKSILSGPVSVKGGDVIKLFFISLVGDPKRKRQARAVIDVRRFVKVSWITGTFIVKIGGRIGGRAWVKDFPEIDPETGAVTFKGRMVDFTTKYTLKDIVVVREQEEYIDWVFVLDKETGHVTRKPVKKFRVIKTYKIIVRHDDGSIEEHQMVKKKPRATTLRAAPVEEELPPEEEGPGFPPPVLEKIEKAE